MRNRRASKRRLSPLALGLAIVVHIALLGFVFVKIEHHIRPPVVAPQVKSENVVDAVAVDNQVLEKEKERKRQVELEKQRKIKEQKRIKEEKRKKAEAEKKRKADEKKKAEAKKKRDAEKKKKAAAEKKRKAEAEKKRKADAKKKAEAEKKREAEKKKKAAAEKKRKAEAERKKREAALKKKLEGEARQRRAATAMSQYVPRIQQKVESNWRLPPSGAIGCNPTVRVTLARNGEVQSAKVVTSSGNDYCDRSVETAFMRASPIPIPQDPELYSEFKIIDFPFRP